MAAGSFHTLVAAVQAADLVDALKGAGPFTVFAPTEEAFAALPEGTLESLLADPAALANILLYHVVPGKVMAADVTDGLTATTLQGSDVTFTVADGGVKINDANIVTTDIEDQQRRDPRHRRGDPAAGRLWLPLRRALLRRPGHHRPHQPG